MGDSIVETERQLFALGKSMKGNIPVTTKSIAVNLTLNKVLGPFYKLYRNLSAAVTTLGGVMKAALNPIKAVGLIFGGMRDNIFFLIGIIALAATGFAALAGELGSVSGLADTFKESLSSLGITSDSIKESFDLFVEGLKIGFDALVLAWGAVVSNMSEVGFLDSIMGVFDGFRVGVLAAFTGVSEAMGILGIEGSNLGETLSGLIDSVFARLEASGYIDYFNELMDTVALFGEAFGVVFGALMVWIAKVIKKATTEGTMLNKFVTFVLDAITVVFKIWFSFVKVGLQGLQLVFKGFIWFAKNGFSGVKDAIVNQFDKILAKAGEWKNKITSALGGMWDFIMTPIQWILDKIDELKDIDLGSLVPDMGDITGGLASLNPFASGGIASGPQSGYPVALHGTEAVVPLPDGRTIPVTMQGGGGGGDFTANITVNGGGSDASAIAKAVGQEVQRAFRSRSRSGGYGRGV